MLKGLLFLLIALSPAAAHAQSWISKVKNSGDKTTVNLPQSGITVKSLGKELTNTVKRKKAKKITGLSQKKLNEIIYNSEHNSAASSTYGIFKSPKVQSGVTTYLKEMLGAGPHPIKGLGFNKYIPKNLRNNYLKILKNNKPFDIAGGHRLFLVISSSIPFKTLRRYVFQIVDNNLPIQMVLRGLLPGSDNGRYFMPTIKYIEALIKYKGRSGYYDMRVDIDPLIPSKYNIKVVPALVYDVNYNPQTFTTIDDKAYVVYGNIDLQYGLKQIEKKTKSKYIERVIKLFNKNQFFNN